MATFATLYSSSSGNSAYIKSNGKVLLIDCGKNCKTTINALYTHSIAVSDIEGILITHEHRDHVAGLAVLLKHYPIPVFGSAATLSYLVKENLVPQNASLNPIRNGQTLQINDFKVKAFNVSHDSLCAFGYQVETSCNKKLGYLTDSGYVPPEVLPLLTVCQLVAIESNYDEHMLKTGPYPAYLKNRISGETGHLCNTDCAQTVAYLIKNGVKNITLCHLSKENNRPDRAMSALAHCFAAQGIIPDDELNIQIAPGDSPLNVMEF